MKPRYRKLRTKQVLFFFSREYYAKPFKPFKQGISHKEVAVGTSTNNLKKNHARPILYILPFCKFWYRVAAPFLWAEDKVDAVLNASV